MIVPLDYLNVLLRASRELGRVIPAWYLESH